MSDFCIVLNFDRTFLEGAKVLIHSLDKNGGIGRAPISIVTSDLTLREEPFLRNRCNFHFVDEEIRSKISSINLVSNRKDPNDPINKKLYYQKQRKHFEKFFCCTDLGYKRNIFLDSDLLCLNSIADLVHYESDADFAAAPALLKDMIYDASGAPRTKTELENFRKSHFHGNPTAKDFNSGVFIAKAKCLGDAFIDKLFDVASSSGFTGDQPVFNKVVYSGDYKFQTIHPFYNVERPFYAVFGKEYFDIDFESIKFLHFTGSIKPWAHFGWDQNEVKDVKYLYEIYLEYIKEFKEKEIENINIHLKTIA